MSKAWVERARHELRALLGNRCAKCKGTEELEFDCKIPCGDQHHKMSATCKMAFYRRQHAQGNLQLLCKRCHKVKTALHDFTRSRSKLRAGSRGISFRGYDRPLIVFAEQKARLLGLSFSAYLLNLVEADLRGVAPDMERLYVQAGLRRSPTGRQAKWATVLKSMEAEIITALGIPPDAPTGPAVPAPVELPPRVAERP
jgi:hypothetical protein